MIQFKRNPKTGIVEAYRDKKKIGSVVTMGDKIEDVENFSEKIKKSIDKSKKV